jgi:hypothetical protein
LTSISPVTQESVTRSLAGSLSDIEHVFAESDAQSTSICLITDKRQGHSENHLAEEMLIKLRESPPPGTTGLLNS